MSRLLAVVILVASVGGAALGWVVFSAPPEGLPAPQTRAQEPVVHRFPLAPADAHLDRETPAVAADTAGHVLLAWASQHNAGERTLWLARSSDGGRTFATPSAFRKVPVYRYVSRMRGKEVNWSTSVVPRLATAGGATYLGWTEAIDGGPRVDFLVAKSLDGGRTFAAPVRVHGPEAARPGFTALSTGPDGAVACAWLDHRRRTQHPFCSVSLKGDEQFAAEALVYAASNGKGICPCCPVDVLPTATGETFVAFRDNNANHRDIRVARSRGPSGPFEAPVAVTADRWQFEGCPHDGPSLAVSGDKLHVLWMSGHTGKRRLYHASSALAELRFAGQEAFPEAAGEQGHPRLVAVGNVLHAVWDGSNGEGVAGSAAEHGHAHHVRLTGNRTILYARSTDGVRFASAVALAPQAGAFQVNPALAVGPAGNVCVAWAELTEQGKSIGFARLPATAK